MEDCTPIYCIAVPTHLLADRAISATAKLLYGVIDSFQKKSAVCYASNERLAEEIAGCSERTISRCITELKDAGYIVVESEKVRRIYLAASTPDGQGGRQNCLPTTTKMSRGVDKIGEGGRQNCLHSNTESNIKKKKSIDPLPVFVSWIREQFDDSHSSDEKNALYAALVGYRDMRSESKSPLNTQRKVDGLLEDLLEKSKGDLSLMCEMLTTARRRCWLSVHAPSDGTHAASAPSTPAPAAPTDYF